MKNRLLTLMLGAFIIALASCEKQESKIFVEGATPPVLSGSVNGTIPMSFLTADQTAVKISWTNPNYRFTSGPSSQNVNYQLEIDTTGANFTNPARKVITFSNEFSLDITQAQLNDFLLNQMQLSTTMNHNIEMRIRSTLGSTALPLFSNVVKFVAKPYAIPPKVDPPTNSTLWMTGNAAPSGWSNPLANPHNVNQRFKKVSETLYELTLTLPGGGAYKLIQEQGNWGSQYHMLAGGTWEGGDFEKKDADPAFQGPPLAGNYKITVDFQRGKFTVTKL